MLKILLSDKKLHLQPGKEITEKRCDRQRNMIDDSKS